MGSMQFEKFSKIGRFNTPCTITEKIDGTNAQIYFDEEGDVLMGSRNRWIYPEGTDGKKGCDNYGFAGWVGKNREELFDYLGPGRHHGEWAGAGIQRNYGMSEKRFYLFNTFAFGTPTSPIPENLYRVGLDVVPILYDGNFSFSAIKITMASLKAVGSFIANFMNPEGIVIYHEGMKAHAKITFDFDKGKWTKGE